jgi:hypothetical protein
MEPQLRGPAEEALETQRGVSVDRISANAYIIDVPLR